ncbi:sigma-B regulator RsbR [Plesiocystis pacifica SIR-1]|uniref:Sigma-B regulator RsbR n=1 Tax=Plesiocystis pacifica SIR-1 TaxID=391625 RepID=A6FZW2_9BACT|nr:STAS domain-containing protein [Plesiocystis pacifica]EDM80918.1 sigma-B regulator RsbR [Plesiocystis pacifica SIR-1]
MREMLWKRSSMGTTILRLVDDQLMVADANPRMQAITGLCLDRARATPPHLFFPEFVLKGDRMAAFEVLARGASDLPALDYEAQRRVDGELRAAYQVIAYGGDPGTVAIQLNDITSRKREELRLRQRGAIQQELLNLLPHAVYWCDENGILAGGNEALSRLMGVTGASSLVGRSLADLDPRLAAKAERSDTAAESEREVELALPDGGRRTFLASQVELEASAGWVGLLHDITRRKRMERELLERKESLEQAVRARTSELEEQLALVRSQRETILELSAPIIRVWDGIVVLPLVGMVDDRRGEVITSQLLAAIGAQGARCVIIDVTAIHAADTGFAHHLLKLAGAARLLGARCVLSGLRPDIAQTLVSLGIELIGLITLRNLESALHDCIAHLERAHGRRANH